MRTPSWRALAGAAFSLGVVAGALLYVLRALPYSTSVIVAAPVADLTAAPTPDFHLGPATWDVSALAASPALAPLRARLARDCGARRGIASALCASDVMADAFPSDQPGHEFFDARFDPVADFTAHLAGEPGHCVTRTGMLAAELLSAGIPARVVQLVPPHGHGHHVVEVWDDAAGWSLVDPSLGSVVGGPDGPMSVAAALASPEKVRLLGGGRAARTAVDTLVALYARMDVPLFSGDVLYPSAWLYVRAGEPVVTWPFRGLFVRAGRGQITAGPAQSVIRWSVASSGLLGMALALGALLVWRRQRRAERDRVEVPDAGGAEPVAVAAPRR
ncbi:MAG TPA: transglutaminase-like domain-containing protein [Myxococcota bacterium]|nr:transglutaminase-like domain-containing protein [Myxococcota bacterium]